MNIIFFSMLFRNDCYNLLLAFLDFFAFCVFSFLVFVLYNYHYRRHHLTVLLRNNMYFDDMTFATIFCCCCFCYCHFIIIYCMQEFKDTFTLRKKYLYIQMHNHYTYFVTGLANKTYKFVPI